ncbi:MAG: aminotransferase class I/II-fold pyridoxal phosphate-dependent enzyme [Xanthomonadales bacterium]|nr:aminotransferase class I/II-fold pyridoxal phosphate-dependent enzyme [Xanthomonadales bacterium]
MEFQGRGVCALEITDDAIVVNSFSKYYAMTGWRVGWLVLPPDMVRAAECVGQNLFTSRPRALPVRRAGRARRAR